MTVFASKQLTLSTTASAVRIVWCVQTTQHSGRGRFVLIVAHLLQFGRMSRGANAGHARLRVIE